MFKTSFATRVISCAVLVTLLLASFPTAAAAAKTNDQGLERKWAKLVDSYYRQSITHNNAPRWVEQWLLNHRRAPNSKKAELLRSLALSNSAWAPVAIIAMQHNGFDANGNVVDKAAAQKSVDNLANALQRYTGSTRNLRALLHQLNKDKIK